MSDVELLNAWREGDKEAGSALFERHFSSVLRFFRSKTDESVEDLVQDTFLACVRGRDRLEDDRNFRGYLFGAARNVLYRHLNEKTDRQSKLDFGVTSMHDLGPTPSAVVALRQEEALLARALRRIPVELQVTLELYYFEELPGPELARALDIPEGTVRSRIRRAIQALKTGIEELAGSSEQLRSTIEGLDHWARGIRRVLSAETADRPSES